MDVLEQLRVSLAGRNLREVARGAQVGESWLRMWMRGEIPDPSFRRIQKLSDYLAAEVGRDPAA